MLLAAVIAGALATAGPALASYAPSLTVRNALTGGGVSIVARVGQNDAPTARTKIFVPAGYRVTTSAPAGTVLGPVTGTASAADLSGAVLRLQGQLRVAAADPAAQAQCGVTAVATWDLHLTAVTQTLDIPMYVVATAGPETALGQYALVTCLPPPDVPVGTPGRAVFGAKLLSASFSTSAIAPPDGAGDHRWTSLWTPYNAGVGTPNAAGSVEAQALDGAPATVKLTVHRTRAHRGKNVETRVSYRATVTRAGKPAAGARVTARAGGRGRGTSKTNASGVATGSFSFAAGAPTLAVTATVPDRDLGAAGCVASAAFGGAPCVDATAGGVSGKAAARIVAYRK
jgi:hypothetical protein